MTLNSEIINYNNSLQEPDKLICELIATEICSLLPDAENKIWHAHPVWFINGNPVVGYSKLKNAVRVLFWSGQSFDEPELVNEGKFKSSEFRYTKIDDIKIELLRKCIAKSETIQWDYKNLVKRKGVLERL